MQFYFSYHSNYFNCGSVLENSKVSSSDMQNSDRSESEEENDI